MPIQVDRERYLQIYRDQGLSAAITALHHEMWEIEQECFEGRKGYQPELYEDLKKYRDFSRELWELELKEGKSQGSNY